MVISYPSQKPSKLDEPDIRTLLKKYGRTHKRCSSVVLYTRTSKCWATNQNLSTTAQYRYRMQPGRPAGKRWTIGTGGERGSRKSMLAACHDDDDDAFRISTVKIGSYHIRRVKGQGPSTGHGSVGDTSLQSNEESDN